MASSGRVEWAKLARHDFERLVNALVGRDGRRRAMVVEPIDGRGGDAGIDIRATDPGDGSLTIYQLKHFPEGFVGSWGHRKQQIKKSFDAAMRHAPSKWILIVPTLGTPSERNWVASLAIEEVDVAVEFCGTSELDQLLSDNPSLVEWWAGDTLREALGIVGRDTAAVQTVDDVMKETNRVMDRAAHMSDNWAVEVTSGAGRSTIRYVPRHDRAAVMEPLHMALELTFAGEHQDLQKRWSDLSDFGYVESITLPPDVATGLSQRGPAWFECELGPGELTIGPSDQPAQSSVRGMRILLSTVDEEGKRLASVTGQCTSLHHGVVGSTIVVDFIGGLTMQWRMARPPRDDASAAFEVRLTGQDALLAERVVRFLESFPRTRRLRMEAPDLGLHDQVTVTSVDAPLGESVSAARDLAAISRLLDQQIIIPDHFADLDLTRFRAARLLLEGATLVFPNRNGMEFTIYGEPDPVLLDRLRAGESIAITGLASLSIGTITIPIGEVRYSIPDGEVADDGELAAWGSGDRPVAHVQVVSPSQAGVHASIPSCVDVTAPPVTLPLAFTGFE